MSQTATTTKSPRPDAAAGAVRLTAPVPDQGAHLLDEGALNFLRDLHRRFEPRRRELLGQRVARQRRIDGGALPDFLPWTRHIRETDWTVAPIPDDLRDRRVEITGPVDRKMIINALNSGANVFMADFEDANAPTWANTVEGQANLYDAVRRTIQFTSPEGKAYRLHPHVATLVVRPRGWHLPEKHVQVDGAPMSGALFDFGLFFYHNAHELLRRGSGPYFYLPKLESHLEARLWNDVFLHAQRALDVPAGSIRATVLIEHVLAAFEMNEILWELRDHAAGLNCGRWDYIFSFIKTFRHQPAFVLPDRAAVTMERRFLASYVALLIETCHRRGAHAMGGMAAQIPIRGDPRANDAALAKVREDKLREVHAGHDGTWVAHPGLVPVARAVFDEFMPGPNQIDARPAGDPVTADDLLAVPAGAITAEGLHHNVDVGIQYLAAWLGGSGCVPIHHLMEDAATAEISRAQVWQWVHHAARLDGGRVVTADLVREALERQRDALHREAGDDHGSATHVARAAQLLDPLMTGSDFVDWLTLMAYDYID